MNIKYSLQQLPQVAKQIIDSASDKVLLFFGEMGTGKTTLIKEIVKQLGVDDVVSSPTFSLVNEYQPRTRLPDGQEGEIVYHFDFYRIETEEEALDMGIEDYFYNDNWCLIEWPEKVKNLLPLNAVEIYLTINKDGTRNISIKQPTNE